MATMASSGHSPRLTSIRPLTFFSALTISGYVAGMGKNTLKFMKAGEQG
jgi:hypothetical protein